MIAAHRSPGRARRGLAAIAVVVVLIVIDLIVVGLVLGTARDQRLTVRRTETVKAFYAAEGGTNMAIREIIEEADEDGDGTVGTISDDGDGGTDPAIGDARCSVTAADDAPLPGQTTLTAAGRCGDARRTLSTVVE